MDLRTGFRLTPQLSRPDLPKQHAYTLDPRLFLDKPICGMCNLLRLPIASCEGTGILTRLPSTTPFGLALGTDSPCADERCARKPWAFGVGAFHPHYRYSCQHSHFRYLQQTSQSTFTGLRNAPLPSDDFHHRSAASGYGLSPVTSSAQDDSISELLRFL